MILTPKKKAKREAEELQVLSSLCHQCKNRHPNLTACDAFPEGIPVVILVGAVLHTKPYSDDEVSDGGVVYELDTR